uniref:Replication factor Mcm10 C-terminal domain-containing protein n=1 Tax=Neospora caninum (strain Liverpool) TaxID=572307 RepID=A0A0F7UCS6_NEOCL|nr:TPA: hypothetical protein BN1204_026640 [Neospora caninum Liverpool]
MTPPASASAGARGDVFVQEDGTLRFFGTPLTLREWRLPLVEARGILKTSAETQFVSLSSLSRYATHDAFVAAKTAADVAILGVVSDIGAQRSTEKSHLWSWTLWDLQETKIKLLLRGEALCRTLQREDVKTGMLLAVLNPTLLEPNPQYDSRCVAVDKADNVLLIGGVKGVMRCGAMTKKQTPCSMMVYVPTMGDFCRFHVSSRAAKSQDARLKNRQLSSSVPSSCAASAASFSSASSASAASQHSTKSLTETARNTATPAPVVAPHRRLLHGSGVFTPGLEKDRKAPGSCETPRQRAAAEAPSASLLKLREALETKEKQEARIALLLRANPALRKANHKVALDRQQREAAQGGASALKPLASSAARPNGQPSQPTAAFSGLRKTTPQTPPHPSEPASVASSTACLSSSLSSSASRLVAKAKREPALSEASGETACPQDEGKAHAASQSEAGRAPSVPGATTKAHGGCAIRDAANVARQAEGDSETLKKPAREGREVGGMLQEQLSDEQKKALAGLSNEFVRRRYLRLFYEIKKDENTPGNRSLFDELTSVRVEMKTYTRQDFQVMGLVDLMPPLCLHPDQTIAELALTIWRAAHFRLQAKVNEQNSSSTSPSSSLSPDTRSLRAEEVNRRLAVDVANVKEIFKRRQKEEKKRQREMAKDRTESEKRMRMKAREDARNSASGALASSRSSGAGGVTLESRDEQREMLQEIMRVRSTIQEHVDKADFEEEQHMLKLLEKQDAREEFKQSIKEIQIEAFFCHQCNEYCDKINPVCSKAGHNIEKKKAMKRFFRCPECTYSPIVAIGHTLPDGCPKCRVALKNLLLPAVSAYKPKAIKPLQNETLTITGDDEDHRCRSRSVKPSCVLACDAGSEDWGHDEENVQVAENALEA